MRRLTRKVRRWTSYAELYMRARGRKHGLLHDAGSPEEARRIYNSMRQAVIARGLTGSISGSQIFIKQEGK